jgi:hypothetical protein
MTDDSWIGLSSEGGRVKRPPPGDFTRERRRAERSDEAYARYRGLLEARVRAKQDELIEDGLLEEALRGIDEELATIVVVTDQEELDAAAAAPGRPILCYIASGERVELNLGPDAPVVVLIGAGEAVAEIVGAPTRPAKLYIGGEIRASVRGSGRVVAEDDARVELDGVSAYGEGRAHLVARDVTFLNLSDESTAEVNDAARLYLNHNASADVTGTIREEVHLDTDCRLTIRGAVVAERWLRAGADGELRPVAPI